MLWGSVGIAGGVVAFLAMAKQEDEAAEKWEIMSSNEKDFFDNDVESLAEERSLNTMLIAIFVSVLGILFIVLGLLMCCLHSEMAAVYVRQ